MTKQVINIRFEPNDSDLGVVTPDAIASAVAELVGTISPDPNPNLRRRCKTRKSWLKGPSLQTEEKLDDKHNGLDEIEHLAEVEGKCVLCGNYLRQV